MYKSESQSSRSVDDATKDQVLLARPALHFWSNPRGAITSNPNQLSRPSHRPRGPRHAVAPTRRCFAGLPPPSSAT